MALPGGGNDGRLRLDYLVAVTVSPGFILAWTIVHGLVAASGIFWSAVATREVVYVRSFTRGSVYSIALFFWIAECCRHIIGRGFWLAGRVAVSNVTVGVLGRAFVLGLLMVLVGTIACRGW